MTRSPLFLTSVLLGACGGGTTVVDPPPPPADNFVFTFRPDAEDQASAQALGWGTVVPDADVTLTPKDPLLGGTQTHRTTAAGTLTIARLTAGDYVVEAKRWLSDTERGRLTAGDDAVGFVAKAYVRVSSGGGQIGVAVPASRRRSLVISEFFDNYTYPTPAAPYQDNSFVELYNNADTVIHMDGMLLARGLAPSYDYETFPCVVYTPLTMDPSGVWVRWIAKFPGSGGAYPIPPGGSIVVATDAIDHSVIVPGGLDLRSAQFEMIGVADVDNPSVPNMIDITEGGTSNEHGMNWPASNASVTVLALATSTTSLPHALIPGNLGVQVLRLPRERILDVRALHGKYVAAFPLCPSIVHPNFDRVMATLFLGDEFTLSSQRKTAPILFSGRKILQHTRSSDADLISALRSPGVVP